MAAYRESTDLQRLGESIVREYHPSLVPLLGAIAWVFTEVADMVQGSIHSGHTYRESAREFALHGKEFTVVIGADVWAKATHDFRFAILDHQISYMGLEYVPDPGDKEKFVPARDDHGRFRTRIVKPDVQEFSPVVERHGAYYADLRGFFVSFAEGRKAEKAENRKQQVADAAKRRREAAQAAAVDSTASPEPDPEAAPTSHERDDMQFAGGECEDPKTQTEGYLNVIREQRGE